MAKRTRDYSLDFYNLSKQKLPKEFIKRMIDLKDLYAERLPRKYRSQVHFKELFYNKYTTNATRAFIIDAAMHFDANRPSEKLYYNKGVRDDVGIGRFQIS